MNTLIHHMLVNDPEKTLILRYEQAVADPTAMLGQLGLFLGHNFKIDQKSLEKYKPFHIKTWKEEHPDMEGQLSHEFRTLLTLTGYVT